MSVEELLKLKRQREGDIAFVKANFNAFEQWRGEVSQREVAKSLDLNQEQVSRFERGDLYGIGADAVRALVDLYLKFKEIAGANS